MEILKFLVWILSIRIVTGVRSRYCGICKNHTLCKYFVDGPNSECVSYDKTALLTPKDILEILNRINERRHYVASGLLKEFPQAANMKKIRWSFKLANFAQRWADQCDRSVKPDKEDDCRDLVNMKVGQNIATVLGPSPGITIKSFVDIWFMVNFNYKGSVTYYNQSKDTRTNYFTQLIWADTAYVGCGRARFFNDDINMIVERLVCNFAPKGNNNGSPVYTIGYPGTQCSKPMIPDIEFPSLCKQPTRPAGSLLRILNSSNNSLKQELDPNNWTLIRSSNEMNNQRNQKARHVYLNNSFGTTTSGPIHIQNHRNGGNFREPQFAQQHFTRQFKMHHGQRISENPALTLESHHGQNYFRTQFTNSAPYYSSSVQDARKHYWDKQCTRKGIPTETHTRLSTNKCTRRHITKDCQQDENQCQSTGTSSSYYEISKKLCLCNEQTTHPRLLVKFDCSRSCQSTINDCYLSTTMACPHRRNNVDDQDKTLNSFNYYDLFQNVHIKSGDEDSSLKQPWNFENIASKNMKRTDINKRGYDGDMAREGIAVVDKLQQKLPNMQDSYHSFHYNKRKKRDVDDHTFKPFWEMDEYNRKKSIEPKSLRYTTLVHKKIRKTRITQPTTRLPTSTETITIKPKEKPNIHNNYRGRITEKYLSFDELMHLRKLSTAEVKENDARRRAEAQPLREGESTTQSIETTTITANTPFYRVKHCTRKLTCTWTAAINGSGAPGGGGGFDVGSRTPPGYVDGCTRTSTCTRDYMDRNKMATSSDETPETTLEDEDYCERRSLNKRRRNIEETGFKDFSTGSRFSTELPISKNKQNNKMMIMEKHKEVEISSQNDASSCICNADGTRLKREQINYSFDELLKNNCNGMRSHKTPKRRKKHYHATRTSSNPKKRISYKCPCNGNNSIRNIFNWAIKLKYCFMWIYCYVFIIRIV